MKTTKKVKREIAQTDTAASVNLGGPTQIGDNTFNVSYSKSSKVKTL